MLKLWQFSRLQLINNFLTNNRIVIYVILFSTSLYQKIRLINFVEFKDDQRFGNNVIQHCQIKSLDLNNLDFLYSRSSSGFPQGPFHWSPECFAGLIGISEYTVFLVVKIFFSQIIIFVIAHLIKNKFSELELLSFLLLVLFNPYLIISSRNTSIAYGYEFLIVIYVYLILNMNKSKKHSVFYGAYSFFTLVFYFPYFIFINSINCILFLTNYFKEKAYFVFGNIIGLTLSIISYIPYLLKDRELELYDRAGSWGLTSYWRINLSAISGESLNYKINSVNDIDALILLFPNYTNLHKINYFLITFLLILSFINFFKSYKLNNIDIFNNVFLISFTLTGVLYTLLDVPLYPHYFFFNIFISFLFIVKNVQPKFLLLLVSFIFVLISTVIVENFHSYIQEYEGAHSSDYGKSYNVCGCCVDQVKICRGQ